LTETEKRFRNRWLTNVFGSSLGQLDEKHFKEDEAYT